MISIRHSCLVALVVGVMFGGAGEGAAQSAVLQGRVRAAETGAPLLDARVRVVGTALSVGTDPQGRFRIVLPAGGSVEVEATRIGFAPGRIQVTLVAGSTNVDIALAAAPIQMPEVEVLGMSRRGLERLPGSAEVVTAAELLARAPASGNEVLRSVAGIHVQEEEGLGLRANIGVRGLNPDRSRTVLVLEDGVPVALNPYGEPEMYYTPPIDRMERIEVVKGSGSILFGPQTIGGVINYVTPNPPATPQGKLLVEGGSGESFRGQGSFGGTWQNVGLHTGILHRRVGDIGGLFAEVSDVTGKVGLQLGARSSAGLKLSVYDEESNSTYVGLTEAMFAGDPYQHPAPNDRLRIRRYAAAATHEYTLGAGASLRTTAYGYTTTRDWQRQDYGYTGDGAGIVLLPSTGNRNRSFEVWGVEPRIQWIHSLGGLTNELDAGLRVQGEWAEDARINGATPTARTGILRDFEHRSGRAYAGFLQNRFFLTPALQVTPGVRVERFSYERQILRTRVRRQNPVTGVATRVPEDVDIRSGDELLELIPGIGVNYSPDERFTLFAGAHRGFSPPRVKDALVYDDVTVPTGGAPGEIVSLELDAERSLNLEVGARTAPRPGVAFEATGFLLDFSNQIIPPSLSAGSAAQAQLANQGETRHVGVESSIRADWGVLAALPFSVITEVKHTFVNATFSADRFMANGAATVNVRGNQLPYAPRNLWVVALGVEHPSGSTLRLDGVRVDDQFADNFETVTASANGRNGLIPGYSTWNLAGSYRLRGGLAAYGTVKNLANSTYVASRRPEGIRAGLPRMLLVGLQMGW